MSSWPATTCAFVTTTPSRRHPAAALHAEAAGGAEHLHHAARPRARTCGSRAMRESGGADVGLRARRSAGTGRSGRSACRIGPDGGSCSLSARRIAERWIGSRSSRAPGVCSATAPPIQTRPSPRQATSTPPPRPSSTPSWSAQPAAQAEAEQLEAGGQDAAEEQRADQREQRRVGRLARPPRAAAARAASRGRRPPRSRASDSAPTISPWAYPQSAISTVKTTMIQSRAVTRRSQGSQPTVEPCRPRPLERRRDRRSTHRALPALDRRSPSVLGVLAGVAWSVGAGTASASGAHRAATSPRPGSATTTARCTPCSTTPRRRAYSCAPVPRGLPRRRGHGDRRRASTAGEPDGERRRHACGADRARTRASSAAARGELQPARSTDERVTWGPLLAFPGLRRGEGLSRRSDPARRATLLSRDGKVLARGPGRRRGLAARRRSPARSPARSSPQETAEERAALYARGFPRDSPVGQNGLEEAFEGRLAGTPGGELLAGTPRARARPAAPGAGRCAPRSTRASRRRR